MPERPLRCPSCGNNDFYVISAGVGYRGGTLVEIYSWSGNTTQTEEDPDYEGALAKHAHARLHEHGYQVEQETLREPEIDSVEGPVKAFCTACLTDMTDYYVQMDQPELLPV
ncbi:MAG: hypothetical protein V2A73_20180 [Pseudomonadota bacterium]